MAIDPLLRWHLAQIFFVGAPIFAFADDVAMALAAVAWQLPEEARAFGRWARASGLRPKPCECAFLPLEGAVEYSWFQAFIDDCPEYSGALAAVGNRGADDGWISHSSITTGLRREGLSCDDVLRRSCSDGTQRSFLAASDRTAPEAVVGAYLAFAIRVFPPPQEIVASALHTPFCTHGAQDGGLSVGRLIPGWVAATPSATIKLTAWSARWSSLGSLARFVCSSLLQGQWAL